MTALVLFGSLLGFMLLGVPIAFAILASGCLLFSFTGAQPLSAVSHKLVNGLDAFPLVAVPLFIFAGNLMDKGGISKRLIAWCTSLVGSFVGGLGMAAVVTCGLFAALTGSGPATVAAIGCIMIPSLRQRGYSSGHAAGLISAAGTLGPIIPPSTPMIIYGCIMGVSIPQLFLGGLIPGLFIMLALIGTNRFLTGRSPAIAAASRTPFSLRRLGRATLESLPVLCMPLLVLGGIYGGVFTPTEAASVSCAYGLILSVGVYREVKLTELPQLVIDSMKVSAMAIFVAGCANLLGFALTSSRLAGAITQTLVDGISSPTIFLVFLLFFLLLVGCFLDVLAAIMILAPMVVPAGIALGFDPLFLGVIFCVTLVIGLVTPPFGVNLFTATAVTGLKFEDVTRGALPFVVAEIIAVLIVAANPWMITWLPALMK